MKKAFGLGLIFLLLLAVGVQAQDQALAPPEVLGEVVYIPFPVDITLDGDLSDWANIPRVTVDRGTMLSHDPANNGSFTFALAASADTLYISMTSVDANIVTGQHDTSYWNEDSLEFYANFGSNLNETSYDADVFQVNINPGDIGKTDPTALTITGTQSENAHVTGIVFKTDDGWGFEAAVPLPYAPEHGREIGFQAQANGSAAGGDRDVKLIWSNADTADQSWQNPSLFGRALFFQVGSTEIPVPNLEAPVVPTATPEPSTDAVPTGFVSVNQTGYFPDGVKFAVYPTAEAADHAFDWTLVDAATGESVASGQTQPSFLDTASQDYINLIDFSDFGTQGTYILKVENASSVPFQIASDLYQQLSLDTLHYFYLSRSGIELDAEHAGEWARPAGHLSDSSVTCYTGRDSSGTDWPGCDYRVDASGGWYDAGDYGKYVVNGGISAWALMNMYEFNPAGLGDGTMNIPENDNGYPDILDEARWEMNFLLGMQVPEGQDQAGMAFHKLHTVQWDGLPVKPVTETTSGNERFLMPPSTAATLNLAATAAQCARVWRNLDDAFADRCLTAAERAWQAANDNPIFLYGDIPGAGGGAYGDGSVDDEFYWAAAELYATTGDQAYHDYLTTSHYFSDSATPGGTSVMNWGSVAELGTLSLLLTTDRLSSDELTSLQDQVVKVADYFTGVTEQTGYRLAMPTNGYSWGSNSDTLYNTMVIAYGYRLTGEQRYLDAVVQNMDYVLGRNGLNFSFVSGYGTDAMQHPHHRFWADRPGLGYPHVPPGVIAGGPNAYPADPAAQAPEIANRPISKRYTDDIGSYSTNEVAINWNAPLAWVAAFLTQQSSLN